MSLLSVKCLGSKLCSNEPFPVTMAPGSVEMVGRCLAYDSGSDYLFVLAQGSYLNALTGSYENELYLSIYQGSSDYSLAYSGYLTVFSNTSDPTRVDCAFTTSLGAPFLGFTARP